MLSDKALGLIVRMSSREELQRIFPQETVEDVNWCEAIHRTFKPARSESGYRWCTRQKGHDGPHIDYNLTNETLIWLTAKGKLFRLDQGDES